MASNNLSFSIALNLLADNFKRGANSVKASLRSIQYQAMAMAAALGAGGFAMSDIIGRMIQMARETNRARTALKNISGSAANYSKNLRYLMSTADEYGQDLNTLTVNFARFSAAGNAAGVSMQNQEKIFTSVTRAATAFGLSGEEANLTFMALQQMMAKGKISSEELRRQMGERMPIAMEAMARAAGVSIQQLDKMLKNGELYAKDILPKFADELNKLLPSVNTDNIETSVNRLRTQFTKLTEQLGVGNIFKKIVDGGASAMKSIQNGTSNLVALVIALVSGKLFSSIAGTYMKLASLRSADLKGAELAQVQMTVATEKRVAAEKALAQAQSMFNKAKSGERVAAKRAVVAAETRLENAAAREQRALRNLTEAEQRASLLRSSTRMGAFFSVIKLGAIKAGMALRAMFMTAWPIALITGITYAITKLVQLNAETKAQKRLYADYIASVNNAGNDDSEVIKMKALTKLINNKYSAAKDVTAAQNDLMRILGVEKWNREEVNKKLTEKIRLIKEAARAEVYASTIAENEKKINEIAAGVGLTPAQLQEKIKSSADKGQLLTQDGTTGAISKFIEVAVKTGLGAAFSVIPAIRDKSDMDKALMDVSRLNKISNAANKGLAGSTVAGLTPNSGGGDGGDGGDGGEVKLTDLQKAEKEYTDTLKKLDNQLAANIITNEEYTKEVGELADTTVKEIAGIQGGKAASNKIYVAAQGKLVKELTESEKAQKEYNDKAAELERLKSRGIITEEIYLDRLSDLNESTLTAVGSMKDIGAAGDEFVKTLQAGIIKPSIPTRAGVDNTFDYKKSESDKLEAKLENARDWAEEIKNAETEMVKFTKELKAAEAEATDLETKLKLAVISEDIKEFREGIFNGVKDGISDVSKLANALQRIGETLKDVDSTGLEKLFSVFDSLSTAIDSVLGIIDTIKLVTDAIQSMNAAKEASKLIGTAVTVAEVANAGVETAAVTAKGAAEIAVVKGVEAAYRAQMAAATAAAYAPLALAGIPLAASQILAYEAMIAAASIPKFANGGIVAGNSFTGDKVLAGVNSGEMILNSPQQSNLWRMLKTGSVSSAGKSNVEFKIKGRELIGILKQEQQRNSR